MAVLCYCNWRMVLELSALLKGREEVVVWHLSALSA